MNAGTEARRVEPVSIEPGGSNPALPPLGARFIIAIDGPAAVGKSSVASGVADRLGMLLLNTGAMYRAAATVVIERGVAASDARAVCAAVRDADVHFDWKPRPPHIYLGGRDVSERIAQGDVTERVASLSAIPELRGLMVGWQQQIAREHPHLVAEGRDQTSVVFPDAELKIFLDASAAVRARRRADQNRRKGLPGDEAAILREIEARDQIDYTKPVGRLIRTSDSVYLDSSALSREQVIAMIDALARERLAKR